MPPETPQETPPQTPQETPQTTETPPTPPSTTTPPETPQKAAETPSDPPADDEDVDDEPPGLTIEQYEAELSRARKQAASYRVQRNEAKAEIARLSALLEAAQAPAAPDPSADALRRAEQAERRALRAELASEMGVPTALLRSFDTLTTATDEAGLKSALKAIQTYIATPRETPTNPTPPATPADPPTIDQQIREAEAAKDWTAVSRLKTIKLQSLPKPR